jgi:hypothetical protein
MIVERTRLRRSPGVREDGSEVTSMTKQADFKARVRARMARTGESYATARAHLLASRTLPALHVTNGDSTVAGLRGTGQVERVMPWRDALHEGPVPDVPDAELRRVRSEFLGVDADLFAARDSVLADHRHGEYVLWFEADLYDQLQIVQILARLHSLDVPAERITLICVGEHLGIAHFGGLGELTSEQLGRLPATAAITLTAGSLEHATRAWAALRAPDPAALNEIAATPSNELRFVAEAYDRLSREYPSTRDGLSLTERRLLAAVADGAETAGQAFVRAAAREARPFLGDTWAFERIANLAAAPAPLLEDGDRLRLTETGREVLSGRADHAALNGVDRWIGGVHLTGTSPAWRWDEGTESITARRGR